MTLKSLLLGLVAAFTISLTGCGSSNTPTGPEGTAVQDYLDENPDQAEMEDEVEPDGDGGDGSE